MRHFVFTLCFILFCGSLFSQNCPLNNQITFLTQEQIDNFAADYPECTVLDRLEIGSPVMPNPDIINLNGLSQLTSVRYIFMNNTRVQNLNGLQNITGSDSLRVDIRNNYNLQNLNGLQNITDYSYLSVNNNDALKDLSGLEGIVNVSERLAVINNDSLTNLEGINNINFASALEIGYNRLLTDISALGNIISDDLEIAANASLLDLNGLQNITTLDDLTIRNNFNLISLTGLENLTEVRDEIYIAFNSDLTDMSALGNLTNIGGIIIYFNSALTNLTGLEGITNVYDASRIGIIDNASLSDISALDILPYYANLQNLYIYKNPNLSTCSNEGICYYLTSGREADIRENLVGCNDVDEVLDQCGLVPLLCPTGDVTFSSQAQIESFVTNYPTCVRIYGSLNISSVTDLTPLSEIQVIDGNLNICDNPLLNSISSLTPTTVGGDFRLKNNDALTTVDHSIDFNGGLYVEDNDALLDIIYMTIYMPNANFLRIANNPNLSMCSIGQDPFIFDQGICSYLGYGNPAQIFNNAQGCNSINEVQTSCIFLPITLTSFQAKIDHKTTLLTWQTATESNNEGFEIQQSTDGINWEKIAWQDGQGTTTTVHTYTHRDENPLFGTSYYRLKQVDFDGAFEYSHIVQVSYQGRDISIYPNPVENTLHIADLNGERIQYISIYDQTGRAIHISPMSGNTIDVSAFSTGMYILKIEIEDEVFYKKFIVQER